MTTVRSYLPFGVFALCLVTGKAFAANADTAAPVTKDAKAMLMRMAEKISATKQFSVDMHMAYDSVQTTGQKIEFREKRTLVVDRPNRLRIDAEQSDGEVAGLRFDGEVLTLFHQNENVYSERDLPGNFDSALRYVVGKLGARVPLARLLIPTLPEELGKLATQIAYVEENTLGESPTDHISARGKDVDYQFWIGADGLLRRIVLNYTGTPGQPQFRADFTDWDLAPQMSDKDFVYSPPEGAEKIGHLVREKTAVSTGGQ